jgi:GNAT superfamily N-acetyltransferase
MSTADVSVRLAWPDDAAAVAAVQRDAWRDAFGSAPADDLTPAWHALLTTPPDARARVLVALERADVRGVAFVHPCHDPDADQVADGEVGELLVDPAHRGAGHGSRLLQAAVDTMRADGFVRARWWLPTTDDALRAFVVGTGWAADGAHRELADEDGGRTLKQVRLVTSLVEE